MFDIIQPNVSFVLGAFLALKASIELGASCKSNLFLETKKRSVFLWRSPNTFCKNTTELEELMTLLKAACLVKHAIDLRVTRGEQRTKITGRYRC